MTGEIPAAARAHARAGDGEEDVWLSAAGAALALAEAFTGTVLVARDLAERVAAGTDWRPLAGAPVTAITAAALRPAGSTDAAVAEPLPPGRWQADVDADGRGWVRVPGSGTVAVEYRAGLAPGWAELPAAVRHGAAVMAAHLMGERGGASPPAAVAALWRPYRRMALGAGSVGARAGGGVA